MDVNTGPWELVGSPPPARGPRAACGPGDGRRRITPACAGTTVADAREGIRHTDHPRLRGDHYPSWLSPRAHGGSPPPARGPPERAQHTAGIGRITPACAGTTGCRPTVERGSVDHPRLRGDHWRTAAKRLAGSGSPPPARGPHQVAHEGRPGRRITPACAGTTTPGPATSGRHSDHPRLRGDHIRQPRPDDASRGSPPPARGPRACPPPCREGRRITPACAGTTIPISGWLATAPDHPRLRGDHRCPRLGRLDSSGSPPPARGPQSQQFGHLFEERITPACAGTTTLTPLTLRLRRITPACAGTTTEEGIAVVSCPDHPRLRGDHLRMTGTGWNRDGSPPPARGPLRPPAPGGERCRITPACAGTTLSDLQLLRGFALP